jgi:hypothetical protein
MPPFIRYFSLDPLNDEVPRRGLRAAERLGVPTSTNLDSAAA